MEKPERDAEQSTPQYSAPILPENAGKAYVTIPEPQPFTATLRERLLPYLSISPPISTAAVGIPDTPF